MCRALRDSPWHFNCCNRYSRWFATDNICSTCTVVEKVAEICIPRFLVTVSCSMKGRGWGVVKFRADGRLKAISFVFWRLIWSLLALDHVWTFWNSSSMETELRCGTRIEVSSAYLQRGRQIQGVAIFDQYASNRLGYISETVTDNKTYLITDSGWLLWKTNIKSYVLYRIVPLSLTLSGPGISIVVANSLLSFKKKHFKTHLYQRAYYT